jgi:hypothetical protein
MLAREGPRDREIMVVVVVVVVLEARITWKALDAVLLQQRCDEHLGLDVRHVHAQADAWACS